MLVLCAVLFTVQVDPNKFFKSIDNFVNKSEKDMSPEAAIKNVYHNKFYTMGAQCQILLPGMDTEHADQIFNVIKKQVSRFEEDISHFKNESEISHINRTAANRPVPVSEEVYEILKMSRKYYDLTKGTFDITLKPLHEFWANNPDDYPRNGEIEDLKNSVGMNFVSLNDKNRTVTFDHKRIKIDLSGIGKGYTLDKVKKMLRSFSVKNAFVSFGESTILALGNHPEGDHWKVGMKNYTNPERNLHTFLIRDGAVSTAGNFYADKENRLHSRLVLHPSTGYPVSGLDSVSVCAASATLVDVLSDVFLVSSDQYIESIVEKVGRIDAIKANYDQEEVEVKRFVGQAA